MRLFSSVLILIFLKAYAQAEVLIGVAGPLSGTHASFGAQMVQGVQTAVDQLNAVGGIEGELVEVIAVDDACDNRKAEIAAQNLVQRNVAVVIGHYCSYPSLAAAKIYQTAGIPLIVPSASLPELTEAGLSNVVRLAPRDDAQAGFAAHRIKTEFPNALVGVISDGSAANSILAAKFGAAFGTPSFVGMFKPDSGAVEGLVADLAARKITLLYCACTASDAGSIAAAIGEAGLAVRLFGPDNLLVPQFWEKSGEAGEGTLVSFAADPQSFPDARRVLKQLAIDEISAEGATLPSYAAVQIFAAAAERVGVKNGPAMSDYMRSGASFPSALGPMSFDINGDARDPHLVWYVWSNSKFSTEYSIQ